MDSALKQMRLLWVLFLAAEVAYVVLPETIGLTAKPLDLRLYWILVGYVLAELAAVVIFRKVYVNRPAEVLRTTPNDRAAIKRWRWGQLGSMACASAIVLFGLLIRFFGGDRLHVIPFYVVGIVATVVFKPAVVQ